MRRDVSGIFNKFAGREVPMHEETKTMRIGCVIKKLTAVSLADPADPTLKEMSDEARKNGLQLRVLWPGKGYTDDYVRTRVNAHIEKGTDGKYRVSRKFDIG
ncbi:MAG: hypothetical protein EPN97_03190 [Alphaproteobacteria bacterium]|nr:MAG: hypothetical protein EPN97_03190 [Alphaproteobacteria bacterium]